MSKKNPVGTKGKRERLRQVIKKAYLRPEYELVREKDLVVLTGLDIAQAMATDLASYYSGSSALRRWQAWKRGK